MIRIVQSVLTATTAILALHTFALAQEARPVEAPSYAATTQASRTSAPTPAAAAKQPDSVEERGFKGRIFEVKHRDPLSLLRAVELLGSGFRGANMSYNQDTRTLSVRDFPENLATIEEALKRLDVAEAPRPDIEFSVSVLIASNGAGASTDVPRELSDVVQQLKLALKYQNYGLMTSAIHRAKEGRDGVSNSGVAESKLFSIPQPEGSPTFYTYELGDVSLDTSGNGTVNIGRLVFNMRIPLNTGGNSINYQNVGFRSPVSLKQGEKVVVGSTTMGDKGLIVVISAKLLK